ncbi:high-affinity branched-chain amino acid ABC transporter membrane protein [Klebsiella pneumoniae]|uniref:High-affinity branched-chain amino acid ABC transporter membrane protein n=1 Tax=Klebsiella pneumoniae TaxID=573 RepID=A0A378G0W2_KLEPN|nr:high-affinity branched-chain amino acid ABC transporter membrane protein [Klebsiella pneumoniae]
MYGLIAIGYTMVYGIIGMINFAHGEVYMVSAYLCAIGLALLSFFGIHSFPLLIFATLVFTIVVTGVYGWAIERIAYRPLRNSTRLAPLISAIGMSLILQNYVQLSQGPNQQGIPTLLSGALRMTVGRWGGADHLDQGVYSRRGAGGDAYPDLDYSVYPAGGASAAPPSRTGAWRRSLASIPTG